MVETLNLQLIDNVNLPSSIHDGKTALREIGFAKTGYFRLTKFKLDQKWASHVRQSVSVFIFVCIQYPVLPFFCLRTVSAIIQVSNRPKRKSEQLLTAVGSALHTNTCVYQWKTWSVLITA